jgi:hypothetical protein
MYLINPDAVSDALRDFGWEKEDILDAVTKLKPSQCYKSEQYRNIPGCHVDYYRAAGLKGENVYTHFYIHVRTGELIINSFHES